jgi:hypothetical protein
MHPLREHGLTRTASYDDRTNAFGTWFDADVDAATALVPLITRIGLNLQRIVGQEQTAKAFAQFRNCNADWQDAVAETDFYLETPLGDKLTNLSAYAVFGLIGEGHPSDKQVNETLQTVEDLLADCPPEHWLPEAEFEPLLPTMLMARARWNLDNGVGVDPDGLALLGGVKLSRIRNMMSGNAPELPKDIMGLLSNEAARAWLEKRDCYLPTLVKEEEEAEQDIEAKGLDPIFVPVARDGSIFTPDLKRNGGYQIGEKGEEERCETYEQALARLQSMAIARWRRPNENDNWGIVSAIEWRRIDRNSL